MKVIFSQLQNIFFGYKKRKKVELSLIEKNQYLIQMYGI